MLSLLMFRSFPADTTLLNLFAMLCCPRILNSSTFIVKSFPIFTDHSSFVEISAFFHFFLHGKRNFLCLNLQFFQKILTHFIVFVVDEIVVILLIFCNSEFR